MKKAIVSLLCAVCVTTSLMGCSSSQETKTDSAESNGKVTLKFLLDGSKSKADDSVIAAVNEKLEADGYDFAIETTYIDDYSSKLALDVAGGVEYDIAWAHSTTLSEMVSKKVFQPITQYLDEYAPDIMENTPDYVIDGGTVKGEVYALPRNIPMSYFNWVYLIRGDLREEFGIDKITTIEQFEQYLEAVKENYPDMYPIFSSNLFPMYPVYANYYFPLGDGGNCPIYVDPADETYTVKSFYDSEEFKAVCEKRKEWYDKGYYPSDESKVESTSQGFTYGMVGAIEGNIFSPSEMIDSLKENVPDGTIELVLFEPETRYLNSAGDNMLAVPSTSKHPKEAVQFINWIKKDQANYDLISFGVEGVNYELNGDAVDTSNIPEDKIYTTDSWMWNDLSIARFSSNYPKEDIEMLKHWDDGVEVTPFVGFTLDTSNIKTQVSQVNAVKEEYFVNLAKGITNYDDVIDEMMEQLNAAGLQDIIDEAQEQIDDWIASQK